MRACTAARSASSMRSTWSRARRPHQVDVGVVEAGQHEAAARVQDLGAFAHEGRRLRGAAHEDQAARRHREGLRPGLLRLGGPDAAVRHHELGGSQGRPRGAGRSRARKRRAPGRDRRARGSSREAGVVKGTSVGGDSMPQDLALGDRQEVSGNCRVGGHGPGSPATDSVAWPGGDTRNSDTLQRSTGASSARGAGKVRRNGSICRPSSGRAGGRVREEAARPRSSDTEPQPGRARPRPRSGGVERAPSDRAERCVTGSGATGRPGAGTGHTSVARARRRRRYGPPQPHAGHVHAGGLPASTRSPRPPWAAPSSRRPPRALAALETKLRGMENRIEPLDLEAPEEQELPGRGPRARPASRPRTDGPQAAPEASRAQPSSCG